MIKYRIYNHIYNVLYSYILYIFTVYDVYDDLEPFSSSLHI